MFHHDSRNYAEAASAAASKGRVKLEEVIHKSMVSAEAVVADIQNRVIQDKVARATAIRLHDEDGVFKLGTVKPEHAGYSYSEGDFHVLHPHAYQQLLSDVGVPKKFADSVIQEAGNDRWGRDIVTNAVNAILEHRTKQRNLIRIEGGEKVKGFLSDKFRRLDTRPLLDAFIGSCQSLGLKPIEGIASDTKVRVRAVMPRVFEPIDNEVMVFGLEFGNSDYGDGGVALNLWTMRIWCTNLAITEKALRQIHLGGRLPDDLGLSQRTYELDSKTTASAIRDVSEAIIGPERINRMLTAIQKASDKEIRGRDGIDKILSRSLDKVEVDRVATIFESPDVENLPPGDTMWRLSNAVSWFAQAKGQTPDRKLELQQLAGQLVAGDSKPVREV
jgi:hypothetical protein